jgi:hypothetical protein
MLSCKSLVTINMVRLVNEVDGRIAIDRMVVVVGDEHISIVRHKSNVAYKNEKENLDYKIKKRRLT